MKLKKLTTDCLNEVDRRITEKLVAQQTDYNNICSYLKTWREVISDMSKKKSVLEENQRQLETELLELKKTNNCQMKELDQKLLKMKQLYKHHNELLNKINQENIINQQSVIERVKILESKQQLFVKEINCKLDHMQSDIKSNSKLIDMLEHQGVNIKEQLERKGSIRSDYTMDIPKVSEKQVKNCDDLSNNDNLKKSHSLENQQAGYDDGLHSYTKSVEKTKKQKKGMVK